MIFYITHKMHKYWGSTSSSKFHELRKGSSEYLYIPEEYSRNT